MSLADTLMASAGKTRADFRSNSKTGAFFREQGVPDSNDLRRVLALPSREWSQGLGGEHGTAQELVELLTSAFKREGGTEVLRAVQAVALAEIHDFGGALLPVRVGGGKTLISFLAPLVCGAARPLLLVPASMRASTNRKWLAAQAHWRLPRMRIESYEILSRANRATYLEDYAPDMIFADEGHKLADTGTATVRRVKAYLEAHPDTRVVVASGTITGKSIMDYWHLVRWCLREFAPLPLRFQDVIPWAQALDSDVGNRYSAGALAKLCTDTEAQALTGDVEADLSIVRGAYRRRLTSTPGVVSTIDEQVSCSLSIVEWPVDVRHLEPHFRRMRELWETPDGHQFEEAVDLWRHCRTLAQGFWLVWDPPPPPEWMRARKHLAQFVRSHLRRGVHGIDSPLQVREAVLDGRLIDEFVTDTGDKVSPVAEWDDFEPRTVPVWIDDAMVRQAASWLLERPGRIAWVEHVAMGRRLAEITGLPYFGEQGIDANGRQIPEWPERLTTSCIASIKAVGTGRNLQWCNEALVLSCPPSGRTWEQMLGRLHRDGQPEDSVTYHVAIACKEHVAGMARAFERARYIEESTGGSQKLLFADVSIETTEENAL